MKRWMIAAAAAAGTFGAGALAASLPTDAPLLAQATQYDQSSSAYQSSQPSQPSDINAPSSSTQTPGVSAQKKSVTKSTTTTITQPSTQPSTGGAGTAGEGSELNCPPPSTGGAGAAGTSTETGATGMNETQIQQQGTLEAPPPATEAPPPPMVAGAEKGHSPMYSHSVGQVSVLAGGGVDGFWGQARNEIRTGANWGATLLGRPANVLGFEVGYNGGAYEARTPGNVNIQRGADITRNGGDAILSLGPAWKLQPYALAGYQLNWWTARGATKDLGFSNDTGSAFPFGAGLRTNAGPFIADARFDYNVGVSENVLPTSQTNLNRYQAQFSIGGTF